MKDIKEMSDDELHSTIGELWPYLYMIKEVGICDQFEWNGLDYWRM